MCTEKEDKAMGGKLGIVRVLWCHLGVKWMRWSTMTTTSSGSVLRRPWQIGLEEGRGAKA